MLLTTTLPLLPPPSASLLPPLTHSSSEVSTTTQSSGPHQHRRPKPHSSAVSRNSTLVALASDERTIAQRKLAIATYGYGWLKPAGCAKTMLGKREEEIEREEVERQLREVELQERMAQDQEMQDRLANLAETGEPDGDRDLDEDIPDADGREEVDDLDEGDSDRYSDGEEEDGMEGDLDDEIPDADEGDEDEIMSPDADDIDANWVYDTRREPDTDEEEGDVPSPAQIARLGRTADASAAGVRAPVPGSEYDYHEREAEDLVNAMLEEDEIFDDGASEHDLDDDVPEPESEQAWEHTDTELEESEMDISILPGQGQIHQPNLGVPRRRSGRMTGGSGRRSSGPWITGPSPRTQGRADRERIQYSRPTPDPDHAATRARMPSGNRPLPTPRLRQYIQTPSMLDSPLDAVNDTDAASDDNADPFASSQPRANTRTSHRRDISTGSASNTGQAPSGSVNDPRDVVEHSTRATTARPWLDGAATAGGSSAGRTLFGRAARRANPAPATHSASTSTTGTANGPTNGAEASSSGGLFTPSPAVGAGAGGGSSAINWETPVNHRMRSRSGRLLGGRRRGE
ncbi:uncharacterized protein Z518_00807 [Rhinocladiella mackenziei CBS 650.93]|uniref:Apc15p protein n=1 Tax=Rhinocladiella mackenziei CBS 650.93 TaxID=1442369 RepID=A0A0D2J1Z8_9EURO|nr:uncharacterized protein Z518_00807 [Rhinocladiella mackenziei CBS 650.93]KIX09726.1 hypothetical protein Z518_00807 [Rhinocladiella mackenziei CBS 650.93]